MDKLFQALSSPVRRKILLHLSKKDMNAGEIAEKFHMTKPSISKHLDILKNAYLISPTKDGQYIYYHLEYDGLVPPLAGFIEDFSELRKPVKKKTAAKR